MPVSGDGRAQFQPIWAADAARCVIAALARRERRAATSWPGPRRSPMTRCPTSSAAPPGRPRPLIHLPLPLVRSGLLALRSLFGEAVFATWEEAELMEVSMTTERGTADAKRLEWSQGGWAMCWRRLSRAGGWPSASRCAALFAGAARRVSLVPPKPDVLLRGQRSVA